MEARKKPQIHQKRIHVNLQLRDSLEKLDNKLVFDEIRSKIRLDMKEEDMITQITIEQLLKNYIASTDFKVWNQGY